MRKPPSNARSKEYKLILKRGCGLTYDAMNGDYDCMYRYEWTCEYCPIVREKEKARKNAQPDEEFLDFLL